MKAEIVILDTLVNLSTYPQEGITMIVGSGGSVYLAITSLHDEVLQGEFAPAGWIDIWLERDPSLRTRLEVAMLQPANPNDIQSGVLTLFPGKRVRFFSQWSHRPDEGAPYWRQGERTYVTPTVGYPYYETEPLEFVAEATAQLFGEAGAIHAGRMHFRLVYREHIIGGGDTLALGRRRDSGVRLLEILQK